MSCESRAVHMSRLLRVQVLYIKCGCAARVVIVEDFSYMHTIGQHKRLSLAHEEGDPTNWGAGICDHQTPNKHYSTLLKTHVWIVSSKFFKYRNILTSEAPDCPCNIKIAPLYYSKIVTNNLYLFSVLYCINLHHPCSVSYKLGYQLTIIFIVD